LIEELPIRLARSADAAPIAAMSRDFIEKGLPWSWTTERVAAAIEDPDTNVVVAEVARELVAFGIMSYPADDAHLLLFAVRPRYRRRGIGSFVLGWLEDVARAAGAKRIRVECRWDNASGRNFYSDRDYHELILSKGMYRGLRDGVRLEKWLRPEQ
jgi:[ribosomal protein S18]-alanine N-acetyltransferase